MHQLAYSAVCYNQGCTEHFVLTNYVNKWHIALYPLGNKVTQVHDTLHRYHNNQNQVHSQTLHRQICSMTWETCACTRSVYSGLSCLHWHGCLTGQAHHSREQLAVAGLPSLQLVQSDLLRHPPESNGWAIKTHAKGNSMTRTGLAGFGNYMYSRILFCTQGCVQAVNMSIILNRARSGAPIGSVFSVPSLFLKYIGTCTIVIRAAKKDCFVCCSSSKANLFHHWCAMFLQLFFSHS